MLPNEVNCHAEEEEGSPEGSSVSRESAGDVCCWEGFTGLWERELKENLINNSAAML